MKSNLFFKLMLVLTFLFEMAVGQEIVVKRKKIVNSAGEPFAYAKFIPGSNSVLVSTIGYTGLYQVNKRNGKVKQLSDLSGLGYLYSISPDGSKVYARSDSYKNKRKYSDIIEIDLKSNQTKVLVANARNVSTPILENGQLFFHNSDKPTVMKVGQVKKEMISVTVENVNLTPVVTINGKSNAYTPNGEGRYLWMRLSPDKSKMLYYFNNEGTFVSDLEGNILAQTNNLRAPQWLDNTSIVGMDDQDDGHVITGSEIVAYDFVNDEKYYLTQTADEIELYPSVSSNGKQIVYHTSKGTIYILKIKRK